MYLPQQHKIWLATGENPIYLEPSMANRHGLIAGATGTGKTVTLKVLAESFSDMGVPVFLADINDFAEMNKVYGEYFAQPYPARSAVQVGKLPKDAPLEIECIAVK